MKVPPASTNEQQHAEHSGPPLTPEKIAWFARVLMDDGLGPDFARSQPEHREVWAAVAVAMEKLAADGAS